MSFFASPFFASPFFNTGAVVPPSPAGPPRVIFAMANPAPSFALAAPLTTFILEPEQ